MNSFNKTKAAIFPMQAMLPEDFPFFSDSNLEKAMKMKAKRLLHICGVLSKEAIVSGTMLLKSLERHCSRLNQAHTAL